MEQTTLEHSKTERRRREAVSTCLRAHRSAVAAAYAKAFLRSARWQEAASAADSDDFLAQHFLVFGGSGPMYNDARKDGTRRIKLSQGGYMPLLPQEMQYLVLDYLKLFFGERFVSVYLQQNFGVRTGFYEMDNNCQENKFSLCVVVRDY